jgi:DNA-directed RNA polymerase specialized sigma24 family protein
MSESDDEIGLVLPQAAEPEVAQLYAARRGVLMRLLMRRFGVPADDAETLVYDTVMALQTQGPVPNPKAWLFAGVTAKGEKYRRARGLDSPAPDAEATRDVRFTKVVLGALSPRAREVLRLRFDEKKTYAEIAAEMGVSTNAAERLVARAAARIRRIQRGGGDRT